MSIQLSKGDTTVVQSDKMNNKGTIEDFIIVSFNIVSILYRGVQMIQELISGELQPWPMRRMARTPKVQFYKAKDL